MMHTQRHALRFTIIVSFFIAAAALMILSKSQTVSVLATNGFSPNQQLSLPIIAPIGPTGVGFVVSGAEPSLRVAQDGTIYVSSIRGVPLGVDLFRYYAPVDGPPNADGTLPFKYEGQPDGCGLFEVACQEFGLALGGGDVDIAVNNPGGGAIPNLALTSLTAAPGVTGTHSIDRGDSFAQPNPEVALIPGDDREWNEAVGDFTIYMSYHDAATDNIEVQRSFDGGETYVSGFGEAIDPQTLPTAAQNNVQGRLQIDKSQCSASAGNLYAIFSSVDSAMENVQGGSLRDVYVAVSTDVNLGLPVFTFTDHKAAIMPPGSSTNQIFPVLAVDALGNLYVAWSDNSSIWFVNSRDQGNTWSAPVRVNQGATVGNGNVLPWIAADAFGHVMIVWYGDDRPGNSNDPAALAPCLAGSTTCMQQWANWNLYEAETTDGFDAAPIFIQKQISDHVIHRGTLSTGGTFGSANRNLLDYFNVAFDPSHRADIAFADDHLVNPDCATISSGACGPDDQNTTRLIRPYFTYQLEANTAVQTSGVCGTPPPPVPGESISGKGTVSGQSSGSARFGFIARTNPFNGAVSYHDDSASLDVKSSGGITSLSFNANCGTFSGNAKVNGSVGYSYQVNACDNSSSSQPGTFFISVSGPNFSYSNGGSLTSGNVTLHSQ
jgi:hypothetical protein